MYLLGIFFSTISETGLVDVYQMVYTWIIRNESHKRKYPVKSITAAIKSHGALSGNERLYRVKQGQTTEFVVSNSPGQAALSVVLVDRVTSDEISQALMLAFTSKDSEKEPNNEQS